MSSRGRMLETQLGDGTGSCHCIRRELHHGTPHHPGHEGKATPANTGNSTQLPSTGRPCFGPRPTVDVDVEQGRQGSRRQKPGNQWHGLDLDIQDLLGRVDHQLLSPRPQHPRLGLGMRRPHMLDDLLAP